MHITLCLSDNFIHQKMVDKFLKNTKVKLRRIIKQQKQQYMAMTYTAMSDKHDTISYLM